MRRNFTRPGQRSSLRSGVMASVITRKRRVQSPVQCVMNSIGFALRSCWYAFQPSTASGTRHSAKTGIFNHRMSIVLAQIHAGIELSHLVPVAVEHQRFAFQELTEPAFVRLAPARVIYFWIYIRVKAIFARVG